MYLLRTPSSHFTNTVHPFAYEKSKKYYYLFSMSEGARRQRLKSIIREGVSFFQRIKCVNNAFQNKLLVSGPFNETEVVCPRFFDLITTVNKYILLPPLQCSELQFCRFLLICDFYFQRLQVAKMYCYWFLNWSWSAVADDVTCTYMIKCLPRENKAQSFSLWCGFNEKYTH